MLLFGTTLCGLAMKRSGVCSSHVMPAAHIAGITRHPGNSWMTQIARNITDANDGLPSQH
jgi:hypothetical protein